MKTGLWRDMLCIGATPNSRAERAPAGFRFPLALSCLRGDGAAERLGRKKAVLGTRTIMAYAFSDVLVFFFKIGFFGAVGAKNTPHRLRGVGCFV